MADVGNACPDVGPGWEERKSYGVFSTRLPDTSRFCVQEAADNNIGIKGQVVKSSTCDQPAQGWKNIGEFYAHTENRPASAREQVCIATASQYGYKQMYYPGQSDCKSGAWDRQQTFYAEPT